MTRRSLFGTVLGTIGAAVTAAFVPKPKMYEIWERDYQFEHSSDRVDFFLMDAYPHPDSNTGYSWAVKSHYYEGSRFQPRLFDKRGAEKIIKAIQDETQRPRNIWMQEVSGS